MGYSACEDLQGGYCNDEQQFVFNLVDIDKSSFHLVFFHSFGSYPGPKNIDLEHVAKELQRTCESCIIETKDSSIWGFIKDHSEWQTMDL